MKKTNFCSFVMAVWMLCLFTMTSCSAAELPTNSGGVSSAVLTSTSQPAPAFSDVPTDAWYAEAIAYCQQNGIMSGTSATTFAPEDTLTRAMLATVLHRMSDTPAVSDPPIFTDTATGSWYSDAVAWAAKTGTISGYGGGVFGVNDPATQEQTVTILWRYAGSPESNGTANISDSVSISSWAQTAVRWANANGILDGMMESNRFDPKAAIKRGEVTSILYQYLTLRSGSQEPPRPKEAFTENKIDVSFHGHTYSATLADNSSAKAFADLLKNGLLTVSTYDYGNFEKVGDLGMGLPRNDERITTAPGDIILYQGNHITVYYAENTWNFTRLGTIDDPSGLREALGSGEVAITFALQKAEKVTGNGGEFHFDTKTVLLNSGYEMPINGLGTYSLHGDECVNAVKSAIEQGVRLIDTARAYGNEEEIGRAIREEIAAGTVTREELFITTKIYPGSDMENPESAIQGCLDRLNIGYVDMMLLHHPDPNDVKAYKAMEKFVEDGKIRSIGLSNWYVEELEEFLPQVSTTPALVQNEIHPYYQENDVIPHIQDLGIVVQGWYPLGGRGHTAELLGDSVISGIARAHGVSSAQVILRWNLQKGVVVIPGSSNPDHIKENTELYDFELTDAEMAQINALDRHEKHDWY